MAERATQLKIMGALLAGIGLFVTTTPSAPGPDTLQASAARARRRGPRVPAPPRRPGPAAVDAGGRAAPRPAEARGAAHHPDAPRPARADGELLRRVHAASAVRLEGLPDLLGLGAEAAEH